MRKSKQVWWKALIVVISTASVMFAAAPAWAAVFNYFYSGVAGAGGAQQGPVSGTLILTTDGSGKVIGITGSVSGPALSGPVVAVNNDMTDPWRNDSSIITDSGGALIFNGQLGFYVGAAGPDNAVDIFINGGWMQWTGPRGSMPGSEARNMTASLTPAGGPGVALTTGSTALWQQMGLPCGPTANPPTVASVFGTGSASNLTTANYGVDNPTSGIGWAIFQRNAVANSYSQLGANDTLSVGTGYWIKSYETPTNGKLFVDCPATTPAPVTLDQGCSSTNGCFPIPIYTVSGADRQNLLGNPYAWNVDFSKVRIRIKGSSSTYTPSQAAGVAASGNASPPVIANTFWIWNGNAYDTYSDNGFSAGNLQYFKSFWVKALSGAAGHTVELLIPKDASTLAPLGVTAGLASTTKTASVGRQAASTPQDWYLRLKVDNYDKGWKHHTTLLGQTASAKATFDAEDLRTLAPFSTPYLYVTLPHPDWGTKAGDYATDFRPAGGSKKPVDWTFEVRANPVGGTVYLSWEGDAEILKRSRLTNLATGETIKPTDPRWATKGVPIAIKNPAQRYVWRYLGN